MCVCQSGCPYGDAKLVVLGSTTRPPVDYKLWLRLRGDTGEGFDNTASIQHRLVQRSLGNPPRERRSQSCQRHNLPRTALRTACCSNACACRTPSTSCAPRVRVRTADAVARPCAAQHNALHRPPPAMKLTPKHIPQRTPYECRSSASSPWPRACNHLGAPQPTHGQCCCLAGCPRTKIQLCGFTGNGR